MTAALITMIAMTVSALAGTFASGALLKAIHCLRGSDSALAVLYLDRPARLRFGVLTNPDRVYIDLLDTQEDSEALREIY